MEIENGNVIVFFDKRHISFYEIPKDYILNDEKVFEYKNKYGFEIEKNNKGYHFIPIYLNQKDKVPYNIYKNIAKELKNRDGEIEQKLGFSKSELEMIIKGLPHERWYEKFIKSFINN